MRLKGLQHVRTSVNHPQSNGKTERFHGTISQECLRTQSFLDLEDVRRRVAEYVEFYNTKRLHSAIYLLTPADVLAGRTRERLAERENKLLHAQERRRLDRQAA